MYRISYVHTCYSFGFFTLILCVHAWHPQMYFICMSIFIFLLKRKWRLFNLLDQSLAVIGCLKLQHWMATGQVYQFPITVLEVSACFRIRFDRPLTTYWVCLPYISLVTNQKEWFSSIPFNVSCFQQYNLMMKLLDRGWRILNMTSYQLITSKSVPHYKCV